MSSAHDEAGSAIHESLLLLDVYRHASPAAKSAAAAAAHVVVVPAGSALYREGDPASDLAVVVSGRLRASRRRRSPQAPVDEIEVLSDMVEGDIVGELAALTDAPRTADVVAVRDTTVVRLTSEALMSLVTSGAAAAKALVRDVVRHAGGDGAAASQAAPSVICVIDATSRARTSGVDVVANALRTVGATVTVVDELTAVDLPVLEASYDTVILDTASLSTDAVHAAVNQADLVLVVADGPARDHDRPSQAFAARAAHAVAAPWEAVLLHGALVSPTAANWRQRFDLAAVHHVRAGSAADSARLGRRLVRSSVGLVISGGGARALAGLGVARVMEQRGIPVDHVGGSSIGALMSALLAMGRSPDELIETASAVLQRAAWGSDFTVPLLSLLSLRNAIPAIDELVGSVDLADTPIPCFVTSVDLTDCRVVVHDLGSAARWVRASASPPALWPPVVGDDGHIHVDGGVLDNLPVEAMRRRGANTVIAVNVTVAPPFSVEPGSPEARTWLDLARRRRRGVPYPTITDLLFRMGIVGSLPAQRRSAELADVLIRPDVGHIGLADYGAAAEIVAAGERAAIRAFDEHPIDINTRTQGIDGPDSGGAVT